MKPHEVIAYESLPDEFIVYRAKRHGEKDWIAYTLNPQVAGIMAKQRNVDVVFEYRVHKADVLALFLRRGEDEVIILDKTKPIFLSTIPVMIVD